MRHVDVALANHACKSHIGRPTGSYVETVEGNKRKKYEKAELADGILAPFVVDLAGNLGKCAIKLVDDLAKLLDGVNRQKAFKSYVRRRVSITVAKSLNRVSEKFLSCVREMNG